MVRTQQICLNGFLFNIKNFLHGNSLIIQWFELCAFTAKGPGSIPGQGTYSPSMHLELEHEKKKKNFLYIHS